MSDDIIIEERKPEAVRRLLDPTMLPGEMNDHVKITVSDERGLTVVRIRSILRTAKAGSRASSEQP